MLITALNELWKLQRNLQHNIITDKTLKSQKGLVCRYFYLWQYSSI